MENLATLIGTKTLSNLLDAGDYSHVVIEDKGKFSSIKYTWGIDFSKIVGIGTEDNCKSLAEYLAKTQKGNE